MVFRPGARQLSVFFRSLGSMFEAGVPLNRALEQLAMQAENPQLQQAARAVARDISHGKSFSKAMQQTGCFTDVQQRLVAAGEVSGRLGHMIKKLADHEEERSTLQHKLTASLVTPLLVSGACLALVLVLPPLCLRGMLTMLRDTGVQLPWPTKILLSVSTLLSHPVFYLALVLLAGLAGWGFSRLWERREVRLAVGRVLLALPAVGDMLRTVAVLKFSDTLASMLQSGIPLLQALRVAGEASGSEVLNQQLSATESAIREGESLSSALHAADFFPNGFVQALQAGEEAGQVGRMLVDVSRLYKLDLDSKMASFAAMLEPIVMLIVGVVVAFTCLAALMPMLKVVEGL
jgi:type IV pilus assembly protein PilC